MAGRTKTVSVHRLRRTAQAREREIQRILDVATEIQRIRDVATAAGRDYQVRDDHPEWPPLNLGDFSVPGWARGVRVEKAGLFQWTVVATEQRGH
jgi:hypothetical protein